MVNKVLIYLFALSCIKKVPSALGFRYQEDTMGSCPSHVSECKTSETLWYECPISCSRSLELEGSMAEISETEDPEEFFQFEATKANGDSLSLSDACEGYVTVYAVVPMVAGMSQFYHDMLEHIASVFPYTVQVLLLPWMGLPRNHKEKSEAWMKEAVFKNRESSKKRVIVLKETSEPPKELEYLVHVPLVAGNSDPAILLDRVTVFLVSAEGVFIERVVSPTMELLERRISVYLQVLAKSAPDL